MLAKSEKPATSCREANYSRDTSSRDSRNIMEVNRSRTASGVYIKKSAAV